jgi:hypothetical protein
MLICRWTSFATSVAFTVVDITVVEAKLKGDESGVEITRYSNNLCRHFPLTMVPPTVRSIPLRSTLLTTTLARKRRGVVAYTCAQEGRWNYI